MPGLHEVSLTECRAASTFASDNSAVTIVKMSMRDCRLVNIVEDNDFTWVLKATLDICDWPSHCFSVPTIQIYFFHTEASR